jgi:hypothetical protein
MRPLNSGTHRDEHHVFQVAFVCGGWLLKCSVARLSLDFADDELLCIKSSPALQVLASEHLTRTSSRLRFLTPRINDGLTIP